MARMSCLSSGALPLPEGLVADSETLAVWEAPMRIKSQSGLSAGSSTTSYVRTTNLALK